MGTNITRPIGNAEHELWQQQEQQQPNSPVSQDAVRTEGADVKPDGISEYAKWMEKEGTAEDVAPVSSGGLVFHF